MNPFAFLDWDEIAQKEWQTGNWSTRPQDTVSCFTAKTKEWSSRTDISEATWLQQVYQLIDMQKGWSVLDIGAGEGLMASYLAPLASRIVCIEPSPPRAEVLRQQGFQVYESLWLETELFEQFDLVLSCRSFGVSALRQNRVQVRQSIIKMNALAKQKAVIVIPESELFRLPNLDIFPDGLSRSPYLLHLGTLLALGIFPDVHFLQKQIQGFYKSLEQCFATDFGHFTWSDVQLDILKNALKTELKPYNGGWTRTKNMLSSVVSWRSVRVSI